VPGRSTMTDELPGAIAAGPLVLLTYRIQLLNAAGRSAGESAEAGFAAGGEAPATIEDLRVSSRETGAVLEWKRAGDSSASADSDMVELDRLDLTAPVETAKSKPSSNAPAGRQKSGSPGAGHSKVAAPEEQANEVRLRVKETVNAGASAGTLDQSVRMGETYRYTAERVHSVTLEAHPLEIHGAPSNAVELARVDVFPPAAPGGLAAIPSDGATAYIDLSWEPGGELDLAGYLILRQPLDPQGKSIGAVQKLNAAPVVAPAFRDQSAVAGQLYAYRVIAVDRSGNQSAPSEPVSVTLAP